MQDPLRIWETRYWAGWDDAMRPAVGHLATDDVSQSLARTTLATFLATKRLPKAGGCFSAAQRWQQVVAML